MTEKRFINDIDNGKLVDTKGELSTIYYSDKVDVIYELWEFLNSLSEENGQLKSENNRLVKQTTETIAEHQRRVFDLIDEHIAYWSKKNDLAGIDVLQKLKKELSE